MSYLGCVVAQLERLFEYQEQQAAAGLAAGMLGVKDWERPVLGPVQRRAPPEAASGKVLVVVRCLVA